MIFHNILASASALVVALIQLESMDMVGSSEVRLMRGNDFLGIVQIYENGTWHYLCADGFGRKDAEVVCTQLGFKVGIALKMSYKIYGNSVRPNMACKGNESSIMKCRYDKGGRCKESRRNAGVLCYNHIKPTLRMNGTSNSGVVEIQVDNQNFTFCERQQDIRRGHGPSSTICRQLGFNDGKDRIYPNGDRTMLAVSLSCDNNQKSIFSCSWSFKDNSECLQENSTPGVVCYSNVRISGGWENETMIAGVVEMYYPGFVSETNWFTMGPTGFDEREALVVCRELGIPYSKVLPLGLFGTKSFPIFHQFNCSGIETNFADCDYVKANLSDFHTEYSCIRKHGACIRGSFKTYEYSSIVCSKYPIGNTGIKVLPIDQSPSIVYVEKDGIKGVIHPEDWDDDDAKVMCQQQGYKTGVALGPLYADSRYPYWMSKVQCHGTEGHIENCKFDESPPLWKDNSFRGSRSVAQVHCTNGTGVEIKLDTGTSPNSGVVKVSVSGEWGDICDRNWTNMDARVACRHLGFKDGLAGTNDIKSLRTGRLWLSNIDCTGIEQSIFSCPAYFNSTNQQYNAYCMPYVFCSKKVRLQTNVTFGAVQVLDRGCAECTTTVYTSPDSFNQRQSVRITGGKDFLGMAQFYENGTWHSLCADGFGRKDAKVVCTQLGFKNGVALNMGSEKIVDQGLKALSCAGNERSILECKYDKEGRCKDRWNYAGVICYNHIKPTFRINGTSNSGVVEIQVDNNNYTFCERLWGTRQVDGPSLRTCRHFGFNGGQGRIYTNGDRTMLAVSFSCSNNKRPILACSWSFKDDSKCLQDNRAAGVLCYKNVRISGGWENETMIAGVVEMYHPDYSPISKWLTIGPIGFDEREALVVCRELGFSYSKILPSGIFGLKNIPIFHQFNCSGNETNFADCDYEKANLRDFTIVYRCSEHGRRCNGRTKKTYEYSSIVCSEYPIGNTGIKFLPIGQSHSIVYVEKDGIFGVIYPEDWDDDDAQVICQQQGYKTGVALGPRYADPRYPYWMSKVKCDGTEGHIENCKFDETPPPWKDHSFRDLRSAARVHCTNGTGVEIRLESGTSPNSGVVKVSVNGEWGVICDRNWTNMDARVACRHLGFKDGLAGNKVIKSLTVVRSWLYGIECSGDEKSIFSCPGRFNVTRIRSYDECMPYVFCTEIVRLQPNVTFGAVQVWDRDNYHLVCAEGFDDHAAQAVCRSLGFAYGINICCSAFGKMEYNIVYSNINCTGIESSILECDYVKYFPNCTSGHYASVACSDNPENEDYELKIHQSGKVSTRRFDNTGFICANGFDDAEATVICKEMGYKGGSAYFHSRHTKYSTVPLLGVPWLANIDCKGTEEYLGKCEKNDWGSVGSCDENKISAVYCYNKTGFSFALVNGTDKDNGLVVFTIDDKEGAICVRDSVIEERQQLAAIVCKQLGYGNGRLLLNGTDAEDEVDIMKRFPGKLNVFITKVKCNGNESSLAECTYRVVEDRSTITEDWISVAEYYCPFNSWTCMRAYYYTIGYAIERERTCWKGKRRLAVKCFP